MRDHRDILDVHVGSGTPEPADGGAAPGPQGRGGAGRPYLQLLFRCSGQYVRAYRNAEGTGYLARCPRCGKAVRFRVGGAEEGATSQRFFEVHC